MHLRAFFIRKIKKLLLYYFYILNNIDSFVPELTFPTYETTDYPLLLLSAHLQTAITPAVLQ